MNTPSRLILCTYIGVCLVATGLSAQNVGINATGAAPNAAAMLDIASTTSGLLIPRMTTAQRTAIATPVTGLTVFDTSTLSYWYHNGTIWVEMAENNGWRLTGNNLTGTEFLGSINAQPVLFYSNNAERMRLLSSGQLGINTSAPTATQLVTITATTTERTALAAFTASTTAGNSAIYGEVNNASGTSASFAINGVYNGANTGVISASGVRGSTNNSTQGSNYSGSLNRGVWGTLGNNAGYSFGVFGNNGSNASTRTGGVLGYNSNGTATWTSIAYYASTSVSYGVYSSNATNNSGTGRLGHSSSVLSVMPDQPNAGIGAGLSGGVLGAWIHGQVYGTVLSGNRFGVYVDGLTITNNAIVRLSPKANGSAERVVTYAVTGITQDIYAKGRGQLNLGIVDVPFDSTFTALIGSAADVVVTVSPLGSCNGLYISEIRTDGFTVRENGNGTANIAFTWIAVTTTVDAAQPIVSTEITDPTFDLYIRSLMLDESQTEAPGAVWWDGTEVRFDRPQLPVLNSTFNPQ